MKLATRLPPNRRHEAGHDSDPRDDASAEVIDLASRTAYPTVASRKGGSDALGLIAGVGFVALLGAATLWGLNASRTGEQAPAPVTSAPPLPSAPPDLAPPPMAQMPLPEPMPAPDPAPAPPLPGPAPDDDLLTNPYASPTLVFDGAPANVPLLNVPSSLAGGAPAGAEAGAIAGGGSAAEFAGRVGGVGGGPAVARSDINPTTTVSQGTMIPAILETAINTDVPGYVRAVVSQDVRSFDGSRVLVPRSSRLIGQYQSGLQAGQKRAYVIWTRLIRPDGVSVAIASPASAFDGRGGLPGQVDTHFFQRFGTAMLLSVIGGLTTIASSGTSVILGGGQDAASAAIQQSGEIGPTVRVRQGEPIRVFTARDLDFSQAPQL